MPSPANLLTDFILRQSYADLPEPIRHQAKRCLLDSMGALSAGAVTPLARLTARTAERFFQGGECTLISSGRKVSPWGPAWPTVSPPMPLMWSTATGPPRDTPVRP